jgi:HD superfamily phosphohydrolase
MRTNIPDNVLMIPGCVIDISKYRGIIDTKQFQDLRGKKQLGLVEKIFPGATHTRFEHSAGTLYITQEITRHLGFNEDEARLLELLGLLHDIGHGPFSHQVEPLLENGNGHEERGLEIVHSLKDEISNLVDFDRFVALFSKKNPLAQLVYDRNIGSDKLDYLFRDAYHTGIKKQANTSEIVKYLVYDDKEERYGIEERLESEVKMLQEHYVYMHFGVYLRKKSVIDQRMFQRAVEELLKAKPGIDLLGLNDSDLEAELIRCRSALARELFERIRYRASLKTAVVFKVAEYAKERIAGKPIKLFELSEDDMRRFDFRYSNVKNLSVLEERIAKELRLKSGELLVATMPFAGRLIPHDVWIYSQTDDRWHSLFEKHPYHSQKLKNDHHSSFAIRVVAPEEKRQYVFGRAEEVKDIILEQIK